nr:PIG-L family deacetylase [Nitrospirota bacterium]
MSEDSHRIRVLALGAHPDDIEAGCGGALITYARDGHQVFLLVLTEGEEGGQSSVRRQEQEQASKLIGAEKVYWGGFRDTEISVDRELIKRIEQVVREVDPQVIFVHYPDDTHQDHRNLATCTVTAARYTRNVLFYEGPTTQNFSPTVFVDIDKVLDEKIEALCAHRSQIKKTNIEKLTIVDIIRASSHFRGIQGRVTNAEAFVPLRMFVTVKP